jgi:hypothetical protein
MKIKKTNNEKKRYEISYEAEDVVIAPYKNILVVSKSIILNNENLTAEFMITLKIKYSDSNYSCVYILLPINDYACSKYDCIHNIMKKLIKQMLFGRMYYFVGNEYQLQSNTKFLTEFMFNFFTDNECDENSMNMEQNIKIFTEAMMKYLIDFWDNNHTKIKSIYRLNFGI